MTEHRLIDDTLTIEEDGVHARCICGWDSGGRFSSMVASVAFAEHCESKYTGRVLVVATMMRNLFGDPSQPVLGTRARIAPRNAATFVTLRDTLMNEYTECHACGTNRTPFVIRPVTKFRLCWECDELIESGVMP